MKKNIFLCSCIFILIFVNGCGNTALQEPASELAVRETAETEDTSEAVEVQEATEETALDTENRETTEKTEQTAETGETVRNQFFYDGKEFDCTVTYEGMYDDWEPGSGSPEKETSVSFSAVAEYENGTLYAMNIEEGPSRWFPEYFQDRIPVYLYVTEDKIYRIFMLVEDVETVKNEADLISGEYVVLVVCQNDDLEESLEKEEEGEHHYITHQGNTCESHYYLVNPGGNVVGFWEHFYWEKGKGMIHYRSGYEAALRDPILINRTGYPGLEL